MKKGDNVIIFDGATSLDIPAERVLNAALNADLESAVIVGYCKNGEEYFASSIADGADIVWLMKRCEKKLLEMGDE